MKGTTNFARTWYHQIDYMECQVMGRERSRVQSGEREGSRSGGPHDDHDADGISRTIDNDSYDTERDTDAVVVSSRNEKSARNGRLRPASTNRRRVRRLLSGPLPADRWQGQTHRGLLFPEKVDDSLRATSGHGGGRKGRSVRYDEMRWDGKTVEPLGHGRKNPMSGGLDRDKKRRDSKGASKAVTTPLIGIVCSSTSWPPVFNQAGIEALMQMFCPFDRPDSDIAASTRCESNGHPAR
ncbi:hypothetical protein KC333_g171 [Hortaea werneckii]|nr:hypothetical protein KC333_g171 [Hortaea werneckii]